MPEPLTIFAAASLGLFFIGIIAGWFASKKDVAFDRSHLQLAVGVLVTIVWAVSIVAEILIPTYTVSMLVHGIMGAVVGYLFSDNGLTVNIGGD